MIGFPLGMIYANVGEWLIHRHVLHGPGKRRSSMWSFHFHEHHQAARRDEMMDPDYERGMLGWHAQGKEVAGIVGICALHAPLFPIAPGFTAAVWLSGFNYYRWHKRAHQDPEWARENLPWHYDHHMGPDQDQNWGVSWPWADWLMGTRVPYAGTEREKKDLTRRAKMRARRQKRQSDKAA